MKGEKEISSPFTLQELTSRVWYPLSGLWCGPYPGRAIHSLIRAKDLTAVLCLQEPNETDFNGRRFWQYTVPDYVDHLRSPIRDGHPPGRDLGREIVATLHSLLFVEKKNVYLHCWGGHGRTGTIVGCLLRETGMSAEQALAHITAVRSKRPELRTRNSPETYAQRQYVIDYLPSQKPPAGDVSQQSG